MKKRTLDTMSDAIALGSPSGKMSKRAREAAQKRLSVALFGPDGLQIPPPNPEPEKDRLLRQSAELRELAKRGMSPRKHLKEAKRLEALAREG